MNVALDTAPAPAPIPARADRRGVWGWMLFDWASQPFHTLLLTFIFGPYFAARVASDSVSGQADWSLMLALAGFLIAFSAPVLGAIADAAGPRKPWVAAFSVPLVLGASALWFAEPGLDSTLWVLVAFAVAMIGVEFAAVFNNAMLPTLVPREEVGRLSGNGWALGYVGGLVSLFVVLGLFVAPPGAAATYLGIAPILGLDPATGGGDRATGPLTAIWYVVFIIPFFLFTPDVPRRAAAPVGETVREGLRSLRETLRDLPRRRSLATFLLSSLLYRDALAALYAIGGIYAAGVIGLETFDLAVFGIIAAAVGALGAWAGGHLDMRRGPKLVVAISIVTLVAATVLVIATDATSVFGVAVAGDTPRYVFYGAGCLIGAGGGALQAASRNLLVMQAGDAEMTEAFGLYALSGKATAFLAPALIFGATELSGSQAIGVTPIVVLLLLGLVLLPWVREAGTEAT